MVTGVDTSNVAENLVGTVLPGGWKVVKKIERRPGDTGGNFSVNYLVEGTSGKGFCKVLNYQWLMQAQQLGLDPLDAIAHATKIYQFERDLARQCVGLSRVVTALDDGAFTVPGYAMGLVSFIVFEWAEGGDIRRLLNSYDNIQIASRLRLLHNLAAGVRQLHTREVAHQDVKPSNTLVFESEFGDRSAKLGDLGRATDRAVEAPHDAFAIAGDPAYAPPEALYGAVPVDFAARRYACDLYQLGSMVSFIFTAATLNALLADELHPAHRWGNWNGSYEEVLPYVRDAFGRAMHKIGESAPRQIAARICALVEVLGDPDPALRGHASDRGRGNQYRLDRIVSELDLMSRRAEMYARSS